MSAEVAPAEAAAIVTPPRERHSLTLDQRRALRRWASSQPVRPSHKACIDWFQNTYNQTISQSTVSHSLSPKYARLDGDTQLSGSRLRFGNWPDVEKLVLLWHQQMVNNGRHPSNEELAEKAKTIFAQLPRYKDETPPEFSPGWIHRFKKRYGLLIRRQRRHGSVQNPADDIPYLVDAVPRFMTVTADVSPAAIRDTIQRVVGVEPTLAVCARVRDEIVRRLEHPHQPPPAADQAALNGGIVASAHTPHHPAPHPTVGADAHMYDTDDDPELVLEKALRALQQEEADAEEAAAAERAARDRSERGSGLPPPPPALGGVSTPIPTPAVSGPQASYAQQAAAAVHAISTPVSAARASVGTAGGSSSNSGGGGGAPGSASSSSVPPRFMAPTPQPVAGSAAGEDLTLTPIPSGAPVSVTERPVRCPFCVNQRMLRTIKEAVEHLSTHVIV